MKAISLWEPWASFMALGFKQNETRSWPTSYRGELLICASKKKSPIPSDAQIWMEQSGLQLCHGFAVCVVQLDSVERTELYNAQEHPGSPASEMDLGDYSPGRFVWRTSNVHRLKRLVPMKGQQGLFTLTLMEEQAIRAQL